ncbi:hypothetical protein [Mycobacterium sp. SMC-17]|uniref:hypothetical protein n=1 Tax=Mycobacterium sp. SMC-17 TaxID=3381628 RepID=UPI003875B55D
MTRSVVGADDLASGNHTGAVDWAAVEAGPVVVHPLRLKRPDLPGSIFTDDRWSLRPMEVTRGTVQNLHWIPGPKEQQYRIPPQLIDTFKRVIWLIINRPAPVAYLAGNNGRTWPAASSVHARFVAMRHLADFLGRHKITQLRDVSVDLLDEYASGVIADESRSSHARKAQALGYIAVIAHLADDLPEADRMVEPSWSAANLGAGRRARAADNSKEIIHPDTFAPLLWWSQQILSCAPDIVAAVTWLNAALSRPQVRESSRAGFDAVEQIVALRGGVLPQGEIDGYVAAQYLIAVHEAEINIRDFSSWRRQRGGTFSVDRFVPQPIPVPVTCFIEGRPWLPLIDYRDIGKLQRVLQAAAAILICTCSGMRGEECTNLQRGALRTVPRPDGAHSYRIDGRIFKAVRDGDDQQDRGGKQWVWATIKPGADAITALERLADVTGSSGLLAHPESRRQPGLTSATMTRWVDELIECANGLRTALGIDRIHNINPDPAGSVTLDRFRRSVAWHIVNQPDGLAAAGVQFGHMQSTTTDGYGSTITSGMAATMDHERTEAMYNALQNHANAAKNGLKASGPAAKRLGQALNRFVAGKFPGTYADLTKKEERRLRSDPDMAVRENPGHACLCLADPLRPETMACSRENDGEPNRNDCRTYCGSRVYTDTTVAQDKKEAAQLRDRLQNVNPILAARITRRITHLEEHISKHENTALPLLKIMSAEEAKAARVLEKDQPQSSRPSNVPTDGDVA